MQIRSAAPSAKWMILLQLVWSKTFKNLHITNIRFSAPEQICFAIHFCCAAQLLLQIYSLARRVEHQLRVFIMSKCLCVKQNGIFCLPAGPERDAWPHYQKKKKKIYLGLKQPLQIILEMKWGRYREEIKKMGTTKCSSEKSLGPQHMEYVLQWSCLFLSQTLSVSL